jgi:hypothetical protein
MPRLFRRQVRRQSRRSRQRSIEHNEGHLEAGPPPDRRHVFSWCSRCLPAALSFCNQLHSARRIERCVISAGRRKSGERGQKGRGYLRQKRLRINRLTALTGVPDTDAGVSRAYAHKNPQTRLLHGQCNQLHRGRPACLRRLPIVGERPEAVVQRPRPADVSRSKW